MDRPTVLIVDDEPTNRAIFRATLAGSCVVLEAASGPEALDLIAREPVDLVLLDVMMPKMDGYEVCRRIKEKADGFLPVLFVTALGDQSDRNTGLEAGADDFLTKPIDRRELLLRSRAFLRLREQDRVIRRQLVELERLQAAKDDLVGMLVHDMRSPLSGTVALLELLREELTGRAAEDVELALRSTRTALGRLDEVLQVRLLEEGALVAHRGPVALEALIGAAVATLDAVARRKGVRLSSAIEGEGAAQIDGKLVQRSIENLLSNALKYTPSGGDVSLTARRAGTALELEVADRGPGIPEDLRTSLFEKFGSIEARQGKSRKGVGLGLYLVKLVALGHGGSVSVADRSGGGSIFRLTLAAA